MKRRLAFLLLVLAGCGPATGPSGQEDPPTMVTPLMLEPPPVYALIGFRDRLQLTSEQIVALDSIAEAAKEQNDSLIDELQERALPTRNQAALMVGDSARPVLEQIRTNNQQAAAAVGSILTPEQQATACELFDMERDARAGEETRREEEERERANERRARRNQGGIQLDTALIAMQRRVWPWCTTSAPARNRN